MELRKVCAIVRADRLGRVEARLQDMRVKGISVSHGMGYGEYMNFWTRGWMVDHATIEIYAEKAKAEEIAAAILETAHTGVEGDGMVAILPVEKIYRIRTKAEATPEEI